jgi:broad specificity phosphatase PhoE
MGPRTRRPSPAGATCPPTCRTGGARPTGRVSARRRGSRVLGPVPRLGHGGPDRGRRTRLADRPQLREFDFGAWDGLDFDGSPRRDPELSRAFWDTPGDVAAPDGESFFDVGARVSHAIAELAADHPGADLIAVAHMGVILAISAFHAVSG